MDWHHGMKNIPQPKTSLITFAAAALNGILAKHAYQGDTDDGTADHRPTVDEMGNVAEAAWDYAFAMEEKWMELYKLELVFKTLEQSMPMPDCMSSSKKNMPPPNYAG